MRKLLIASFAILAFASPTSAWDVFDTINLGQVVAAEEFCDLAFDEDAIFEYIKQNVPADLANFPQAFESQQYLAKLEQPNLNALDKRVRCMQTERLAKLWGFIE